MFPNWCSRETFHRDPGDWNIPNLRLPELLRSEFHDVNDMDYDPSWQRPLKALQHEMKKCFEVREMLMTNGGDGRMLEMIPQHHLNAIWTYFEAMWKHGMMM